MQPLHRLFGKDLSNIIDDNQLVLNKNKSISSQIGRQTRGISQQDNKAKIVKKVSNETCQSIVLGINKKQKQEQKDSLDNVQMVPDYFQSCLSHMIAQQQKQYNLVNYMSEQKSITSNMRGILIDWLIDLHLRYKMFPQTLFTVVMIIDKYLMKKQIQKQNLQLLGATAFFIAAKYQETYSVPEAKQLVHLSADAFTKKDLLNLQAQIIKQLDFNLIMNNALKFMQPLVKIIKMNQKNKFLAQYILQLTFFDMHFLKYKPSLLASACIYLVNKIRRVQNIWPDTLVSLTGYQQKSIKTVAKQLCLLFENIDKFPNTKSLQKKFSLPKFGQVSKIRLERRQKQK